ncbi:30S ribosomal protein S10 [Candidatus Woesearchaeota archaeon]|nr:30S ribosomal protein S10 [Candidatus Woesearchaeota archaeon]
MATRARIKVASIDIGRVNQICKDIRDIAEKTGVDFRGPIPLPTKRMKVSTRKSPSGEGKATWEKYELRVHKRLIDLGADERTLRMVMRVPIPEGLSIEIEMVDN